MAHPTGPHHPYWQAPPAQHRDQGLTTVAKFGVGCAGVLLAVLLMLVMLVGCAALLGGGGDGSAPNPTTTLSPTQEHTDASDDEPEEGTEEESDPEPTTEPAEEEEHPGLDETVEHGDWGFTVHSIDYDVPASELDEYFAEEPSGQWVAVEMTVTNLDSGPQRFSGYDQVLMDAEGSMYRYDIWASDLIGDELNPGMEASGRLAYDVPEDFEADHVLVNGRGSFTDGVRVELD